MQAPLRFYWLPILSGILIGTSYIPFLPWALFFLYVPLWQWWLTQTSLKKVLLGGWITQMILTWIGFNWVTYTIHEFGHLPWTFSILGFLLFSSFAHLHIPLSGALWWWICRRLKWSLQMGFWLLPACHLLMELTYPMIFEWHLGYTLMFANLPALHLAEWIGFRGLSALIFILNALVLVAWQNRRTKGWRPAASAIFCLVLASQLVGLSLRQRVRPADDRLKVMMVQANIGNQEKQEAENGDLFRDVILQKYLQLTEEGLKIEHPDFALWPETAFPHLLSEPYFSMQNYALRLRQFLRENQLPLATGSYSLKETTDQVMNSFFTLGKDGALTSSPYSKTHLLAFGEYFPGADWFPFIKSWFPEVGSFGRGHGPSVLTLDRFRLGPQICYESLFDAFTRDLANKNAQIIVNVTNDSWYGNWQEPWQHMYMTLARAIEVRRPLLRVTNTGISTVILADGTILEQSPLHQEWVHTFDVPYSTKPATTIFMGLGYYFSWSLVVIILLVTLWRNRRVRLA